MRNKTTVTEQLSKLCQVRKREQDIFDGTLTDHPISLGSSSLCRFHIPIPKFLFIPSLSLKNNTRAPVFLKGKEIILQKYDQLKCHI